MNILYLTESERGIDRWREEFAKVDSSLTIYGVNDQYDPESIEVVLAWKPPAGFFPKLTNLKLIHALGMGVDHIFKCPDAPTNIPIARIIDEDMSVQMAEYVLYGVLSAYRKFNIYQAQQREGEWQPRSRNFHDDFKIGIMGYGELGKSVATRLQLNAFNNIRIWSSSPKSLENIQSFHGKDMLMRFTEDLDVLICLLPLTAETKHILNGELFEKMGGNAYLINPARGDHLLEEDLIVAITRGQLSGALLDVFTEEPLPSDHPFWQIPEIEITPHIAASTNPRTASDQVIQNILRIARNESALNLIDPLKEY